MVLLHRLSALKYKQRYFDFSQNALILTPNEEFSLHIQGLAEGLQIGSVHRLSVEQYYLEMLLQYDAAFKPENKIVSEMQVRQDYVDYIATYVGRENVYPMQIRQTGAVSLGK